MEYIVHLSILFAIYAIVALSLNLVVGYTGLVSVTQAAFYAVGAYATAILGVQLGLNFFLTVGVGMVCAALLAYGIGWVTTRLKGDYYVLATVGFSIIVFTVLVNWDELTHGALGFPGIVRPTLFGLAFIDSRLFLALMLIALGATYAACVALTRSSFGRALKAIREDEQALQAFGYRTTFFKLAVFMFAAAVAAAAGSFYAAYIGYIDPQTFTSTESIFMLAMVILGGLGSHYGSLLGAALVVLLPEFLRFWGLPADVAAEIRQLTFGCMLVVFMLYRPQGILGQYRL